MNPTPITLASASPRRRELLEQAGISYELLSVSIDETPRCAESAADLVTRLATEKAQAALALTDPQRVIIGADTVVVVDEMILGKPRDRQHAERLLGMLAGRDHEVLSAVALSFSPQSGTQRIETRLSRSRVWFRDIVRHEALFDRVAVGDRHAQAVAAV